MPTTEELRAKALRAYEADRAAEEALNSRLWSEWEASRCPKCRLDPDSCICIT